MKTKKKRRIPSTLEYVKQPQRLRKREAVKIIRGMCSHLIGGGGVVVVVVSAVIVEILLPIDLIDAFKINTLWRSVLCYWTEKKRKCVHVWWGVEIMMEWDTHYVYERWSDIFSEPPHLHSRRVGRSLHLESFFNIIVYTSTYLRFSFLIHSLPQTHTCICLVSLTIIIHIVYILYAWISWISCKYLLM